MKLIKDLIQIQSYSDSEQEIKQFIVGYCQNMNLPVSVVGSNLNIAINNDGSFDKLLIFNAHLDTVSCGDMGKWGHPPFGVGSGAVSKGKVYGLGASDEKASVAALLLLAEKLSNKKLNTDVWLSFVVREEVDGEGTKSFLKLMSGDINKYKKVGAVICEPTGLKEIQIGHKGNAFLKITCFGDSGHGSQAEEIKNNAIKSMYQVINKLDKLKAKWQEIYKDSYLGVPTIGLTSISAGDLKVPNKFADYCEASFDIRTTPKIHKKMKKLVQNAVGSKTNVIYLYPPCEPGLTPPKEEIVMLSKKVLPGAKVTISYGSTDLCFFTSVGIPGVIIGPGEKNVVHKPNEYCDIGKITKAVDVYQRLISMW